MVECAEQAVDCSLVPMAQKDRGGRMLWRLTVFVVVLGIAARVALYLARLSFWGDEAFLLLNLRNYDTARLLTGRLDYVRFTQAGPPLFLLILKGMTRFSAATEYAMRLLPLVCSCAALPAFAALARRLLNPAMALAAVSMLAFSDNVIAQAATVKQYSGDLLIAVLLPLLMTANRPACPLRRLFLCALTATVSMWFSHATVFVFAAVSLALLPWVVRGGGRVMAKYTIIQLLPATSFILLYLFSIRAQRDPYLYQFWADAFFDRSRPWAFPLWFVPKLWEIFTYIAVPIGSLLLIPAGIAVVSLWRSRRFQSLIMLLSPLAFVVLAAIAHQYPLSARRVTLFLMPYELLLACIGLQVAWQSLGGIARALPAGCAVAIIAVAIGGCVVNLVPVSSTHFRPTIEYLRAHRQPGEPLYIVGEDLESVLRCYWPDVDPLIRFDANPDRPASEQAFWIFFRPDRCDKERILAAQSNARLDEPLSRREQAGGWALRFERASVP